ncbi:hypothetical protein [Actinokineospora sp. NBRC 105648]|uniref:hypothetical protein n=1 Tax=Actinokineospora sp. NBRC 105648 TaxID=3032206 RepID=UPI0025572609|nr:hypothetical protein [Actinokineospora sp. NBRC 105648]
MTGRWWLRYVGLGIGLLMVVVLVIRRAKVLDQPVPQGRQLTLAVAALVLVTARGLSSLVGVSSWGGLGDLAFLVAFFLLLIFQLKAGRAGTGPS